MRLTMRHQITVMLRTISVSIRTRLETNTDAATDELQLGLPGKRAELSILPLILKREREGERESERERALLSISLSLLLSPSSGS